MMLPQFSPRGARASTFALATLTTLTTLATLVAPVVASTGSHLLVPLSHPPLSEQTLPLRRRDDNVAGLEDMENWNTYGSYMFNISVGTPPQEISMTLSLATWDTWVPDISLKCSARQAASALADSCVTSAFASNESSTFFEDDSSSFGFTASYVDGSYAYGHWGRDTFSVGGASVGAFMFGVASYVEQNTKGVLALGYPVLNSISTAEIFISWIAGEGVIATPAFSIWADDAQGMTANLLFGAVDSSKFDGELARIGMTDYYSIAIDSVNATNSATQELSLIDPDSWTWLDVSVSPSDTLSHLPHDMATYIWGLANATYDPDSGYVRIPCSAGQDDTITFKFRFESHWGPVLEVPLRDLVLSREAYTLSEAWGDDWCMFAVLNETRSSLYSLGKPMWTRQYLAFDTFNHEMAFAPTKFNVTESNIVTFDTLGADIPESSRACFSSEWVCSGGSSSSSSYSSSRGLATPIILAIVIVVIVCIALCAGIAGSILCCRRQGWLCFKRRKETDDAIARHTAARMSQWPESYATSYASGLPAGVMTEKYAGGPPPEQQPAMTENYAGVSPFVQPPQPAVPARGSLALPRADGPDDQGAAPVSPMSAIAMPVTPPPTVPLPSVPAPTSRPPSPPVPTGGASARLDKGKGKAGDEEQ